MIKLNIFSVSLRVLCVSVVCILFSSCHHNPLKIDVSQINVPPVKIDRLERDMFTMPPDSIYQYTSKMVHKYGTFYKDFVTGFINDGGVMDSTYAYSLKKFISDRDMRAAYDSSEKVYPDVSFLETGITDVFKHFNYYFPAMSLPRVITVMSGFNYQKICYDSTLAISLEMYLGTKNEFYAMLNFPRYKTMHMNKNYILSDVVYGWLFSIFKPDEDKNDLLATLVHEGKVMYALDAMFPDLDDTMKIQYTEKQLKWCEENEFNMWAFIVQKKYLYTTDQTIIAKFTDDGPFTSFFNRELTPARTGIWLGWQIIRTYMKNNPSVTLAQLMNEKSADKILQQSGYKPSK